MTDASKEAVARYDLEQPDTHMGSATMKLEPGFGDWVRFSDYEALSAKLAEAQGLIYAARQERDAAEDQEKELAEELRKVKRKLSAAEADHRARIAASLDLDAVLALVEALEDIADPKRLTSHGDPVVLRDHARAALARLKGGPA